MDIPMKIAVYEAEEGGYWAKVPALPGCATEGDTIDELMVNLREAIEGWLGVGAKVELDPEDGEPIKVLTL